jgi:glycosyltransferase involved in cell wall biosynthesis
MRLRRDRHGRAFLARAPSASVVVATRDRSASLSRCLDSLLALADPDHELVVVDNAPATTTTESLIAAGYGVALTAQDGCT